VEKPLVIEGRFAERYLQLPSRVIETTIQHHIRAFPLGENRFAFVANGGDPDTVRAGTENVVEGRLEDASFTFERDVKVGIDSLAERLGAITFFQGAGSFADKTERLTKLVESLGGGDAALEAARLAKADQASELVREFTELEGHIGAEYARIAGYPEAVSAAIDEQYLPDGADAPLPQTETGRVLSAADKIDTLNVSFGLGQRPTGSRDPYGLRRAAIGLDRLATEGNLAIPRELMDPEVAEFVEERFEGLLDAPVEYVRAARTASVRDLGGVARLAQALAELPDERFAPIHTAYLRASRLAEKEEGAADALDPALLIEEAENEVVQALERVDPQIAEALDAGDFGTAVESAAELGPLLDRFFEDVLVMAEDRAVRANRLRLLLNVRDTLGRLGELSQIPRA
jgi:glycyl-tRNA synthetase beta subunit